MARDFRKRRGRPDALPQKSPCAPPFKREREARLKKDVAKALFAKPDAGLCEVMALVLSTFPHRASGWNLIELIEIADRILNEKTAPRPANGTKIYQKAPKSALLVEEPQAPYPNERAAKIQKLVTDALEAMPDAQTQDVLTARLPKLPRNTEADFLIELVRAADLVLASAKA